MKHLSNPKLTKYAQRLRREMTAEERHLWYDFLSGLSIPFNRQKVMGNYIADFYCDRAKLVIELDGSQHYEPENKASDQDRDEWMRAQGIKVLRFSNSDVRRNFSGVCEEIMKQLGLPV